jgi:ribonucleoside-diphosphate reductase alpha chain
MGVGVTEEGSGTNKRGRVWADVRGIHEDAVRRMLHNVPDGAWNATLSPGARLASEAVFLRSYARVKPDGTRETWRDAVVRYGAYIRYRMQGRLRREDRAAFDARLSSAIRSILRRDVLPSMRALWAAGDVLERSDIAAYNCFAMPCDTPAVFWEAPFILMHGTGVGYSVRRSHVAAMPIPAAPDSALGDGPAVVRVGDSTEGWRDATEIGVKAWFQGGDVIFDFSGVRPRGAKLATKGGTASGPEPLRTYLDALRTTIRRAGAEGRHLTTLEAHDLLCVGARGVQVGGSRRSAMIAVFDLDDADMLTCKDWTWPDEPGITEDEKARRKNILDTRGKANNSGWNDRISALDRASFDRWWAQLVAGRCGEPGSASVERGAYRAACVVDGEVRLIVNPCAEIFLAFLQASGDFDGSGGGQFCNLTNVMLKPGDDGPAFLRKAADAAFFGTCQAALTSFPGIREGTRYLTERDALLGVGLSGQVDCPAVSGDVALMRRGNAEAIQQNRTWAPILGINEAAGVTCVKPDGSTSVLCGSGSGVHPHYAPFYLRRMSISSDSPVAKTLRAAGMPCIPTDGGEARAIAALRALGWADMAAEAEARVTAWSFEFPIAAPAGALCRDDESPIGALERVRAVTAGWLAEKGHSVSATIYVKQDEWRDVGDWYYAHRTEIGGLTFYPADEGSVSMHAQPLTDLTEAEYAERVAALPVVDWSTLALYENGVSEAAQTFACTSGACSIV